MMQDNQLGPAIEAHKGPGRIIPGLMFHSCADQPTGLLLPPVLHDPAGMPRPGRDSDPGTWGTSVAWRAPTWGGELPKPWQDASQSTA